MRWGGDARLDMIKGRGGWYKAIIRLWFYFPIASDEESFLLESCMIDLA